MKPSFFTTRKSVLITGANRGLGKELARKLSKEGGWDIYVTARDPDTLASEYKKEGINFIKAIKLDLFKSESKTVIDMFNELPALSAVIHCASPYTQKKFLEHNLEEIEQYNHCMKIDAVIMRQAVVTMEDVNQQSSLVVTGAVIGQVNFHKRGLIGLVKAQQRQLCGILDHECQEKKNKVYVRHLNLGSFRDAVSAEENDKYIETSFVVDTIEKIIKEPANYPANTNLVSKVNEREYNIQATIEPNSEKILTI